jgi:hypothetical protein
MNSFVRLRAIRATAEQSSGSATHFAWSGCVSLTRTSMNTCRAVLRDRLTPISRSPRPTIARHLVLLGLQPQADASVSPSGVTLVPPNPPEASRFSLPSPRSARSPLRHCETTRPAFLESGPHAHRGLRVADAALLLFRSAASTSPQDS